MVATAPSADLVNVRIPPVAPAARASAREAEAAAAQASRVSAISSNAARVLPAMSRAPTASSYSTFLE